MLPELFLTRMEKILGEEYGAFVESLRQERLQALRWNPLKLAGYAAQAQMQSPQRSNLPMLTGNAASAPADISELMRTLGEKASFHLTKVPWAATGFYYESMDQPGRHPYHAAGLYYIQEPSAMAPAPLLETQPGERILDLCAAPGGKASQIAAAMQGRGLLVCNEIHPARAKILSENMERMGTGNACVTNESPLRLTEIFPEYFDRILVDAPCSGEGMFRKNEDACAEWSLENVMLCAKRQAEILDCAARMLRPGGRMVYSTCTFSEEEDEGSVERFLSRHPEFQCLDMRKLWPHKAKGEGHFAAVLVKENTESYDCQDGIKASEPQAAFSKKSPESAVFPRELAEFAAFAEASLTGGIRDILREGLQKHPGAKGGLHGTRYLRFGDNLYLMPEEMPSLKGLKTLRPGLHLGTLKKSRFEPSHALALALSAGEAKQVWNLDSAGTEVAAYLGGQTLAAQGEPGWHLICVDGFSLGWGKLAGGMMKNHYPKGLRRQ